MRSTVKEWQSKNLEGRINKHVVQIVALQFTTLEEHIGDVKTTCYCIKHAAYCPTYLEF
jgi:hypothetical protein